MSGETMGAPRDAASAPRDAASAPFVPAARRRAPDKLAVLCRRRPLAFLIVRLSAAVVVVCAGSFVVDAFCATGAWLTHFPFLFYLLSKDDLVPEDDELAFAGSIAPGLPWDEGRFAVLVAFVVVLTVTQMTSTRGLGPGIDEMRASASALPWPKGWARVAGAARSLRPAIIALCAVSVCASAVIVFGPPDDVVAWIATVFVIPVIGLVTVGVLLGARPVGLLLSNALPSALHVAGADLQRVEDETAAEAAADAIRTWPTLRELRLTAAVRVFASPPPPAVRRHRRRHAWWTDTETSLEDLAIELVLEAILESEASGLIVLDTARLGNPHLAGMLPADRQPHGLAALVAGRHREGAQKGRTVKDRLSFVLLPLSSPDQYARVIDTALEDLAAAGVARHPQQWVLDDTRLTVVDRAIADSGIPTSVRSRAEVVRLRRTVGRRLRRRRTTEAESGLNIVTIALTIWTFTAEHRARRKYRLPDRPCGPPVTTAGVGD